MSEEGKEPPQSATEAVPTETVLDIRQAADFIGVSPQRVNRLRRRGEISGTRVGWRGWRFREADLMAYVERAAGVAGSTPPPDPAAALKQAITMDLGKLMSEMGPTMEATPAVESALAKEAPIVRMANAILVNALECGASDLHLEPDRQNVRVRIRVDGLMQQMMTFPKHIQFPMMNRFKVMADITPFRSLVPKFGAIPVKHGEKEFNLRVSVMPSLYGESIVLHILEKTNRRGLADLGFANDAHWHLQEVSSNTSGLILFAGPPGSGLTTTAFSVLNKINSVTMKICTLEGSIEYSLPGIEQSYQLPPVRTTRTEGVRALLRQNADVLFLGDVVDEESARCAIEAAQSGVLVMATISALDSIDALRRMASLGVSKFDISQGVTGVVGQRLVRRICEGCREEYTLPVDELRRFGLKPNFPDEQVAIYRGAGCEKCRNRGYLGRIGLYEVLEMNSEIAELVRRDAQRSDLKDAAQAAGLKTLANDGIVKLQQGLTTPDEIMKALGLLIRP